MIVAGIMSGTSADGVDVALANIRDGKNGFPKLRLLAHEAFPYPAALRKAVLAAMNASATSTAELARLNWRLGIEYARVARAAQERHKLKALLIGCHGQTLYHQAAAQPYAGTRFACTWQAGEASIIAAELGLPVVSNFRPADIAVGGQGAPLVPLLDYVIFRHATRGRVLQNIGGIANFTAIPPGASAEETQAFDSGPGNMLIDALMFELYGKAMDKDGRTAATGTVLEPVLKTALKHPLFRKTPPKSAGREEFGREYAVEFLASCRKFSMLREDAIATATALTSASIANSYIRFASERMNRAKVDYIVSGGGAHNRTLMSQLVDLLKPHGCRIAAIDSFGMPAQAKEAAAFALLAWQTWHHRPGNLPSATGATRPVILGQVSYA
jgi:anhydro-N-acetylmuramic acid kinase